MSLLFFDPKENLLTCDGVVNDFGVVLDNPRQLYQRLLQELPWQSDIVTLYGKTYVTERQVIWMGDENISYRYSGHQRVSIPWTNDVFHVKQLIEHKLSELDLTVDFNACLLNYYPSGNSGMGYHADDEPELGNQPVIACLSLGATRKFVLKHNLAKANHISNAEMWLESGQLIVMRGATQQHWKHSITKSQKINQGRISLTFRKVVLPQ